MIRRGITIAAVTISILLVSAAGFARNGARPERRLPQRQSPPDFQRSAVPERGGEAQRQPVSGTAGGYQQRSLQAPPGGAPPPVASENLEQMREVQRSQQYLRQQELDRALRDDDTRSYDVGEDYLYPGTAVTPAMP